MKNIVTCLLLLFCCCKENLHGQDHSTNKINKNQNLETIQKVDILYNSDSIKKYYKVDSDSIDFKIISINDLKELNFDLASVLMPIKENEFGFTKLKKINKYFIVKTFDFSNEITYKILIYNI